MSSKILIGMLMFYVLCQVICNFVDGNAMVTSANVADLNNASATSVTTSADTSGTPAQYVTMATSFFATIGKIAFFDYTVFRNIDGTANDWAILRYLLICVGIAILIEVAVVFRQIITG
jgi:hypothetical protein